MESLQLLFSNRERNLGMLFICSTSFESTLIFTFENAALTDEKSLKNPIENIVQTGLWPICRPNRL